MRIIRFENGLTVSELKLAIADWPETNSDGEPCTVWLGDADGLSNVAIEIAPLNLRGSEADLLISHNTESPSKDRRE